MMKNLVMIYWLNGWMNKKTVLANSKKMLYHFLLVGAKLGELQKLKRFNNCWKVWVLIFISHCVHNHTYVILCKYVAAFVLKWVEPTSPDIHCQSFVGSHCMTMTSSYVN